MKFDEEKMQQNMKLLLDLATGKIKEEDIEKKMFIVTLTGQDALLYHSLKVVIPEQVQDDIDKMVVMEGLRVVGKNICEIMLKFRRENGE